MFGITPCNGQGGPRPILNPTCAAQPFALRATLLSSTRHSSCRCLPQMETLVIDSAATAHRLVGGFERGDGGASTRRPG